MKPRESQTYFPQLDGIRTLAVLMVIVSHWYRGHNFPFIYYGGAMGVSLFFVLSGFLITHILLGQQPGFLEGDGKTKKNILTTFYIRRTLRIFPIYYLYVAVLIS
jgi:peptidoglycan/LPS O-acetylase OafA/YrhL